MANYHQHSVYGRTRRPKNILGFDGTIITAAANGNDDTILGLAGAKTAPVADLTDTITDAAINTITRTVTLTFANSGLADEAAVNNTQRVLTRGFSKKMDGRHLPIVAVDAAADTIEIKVPEEYTYNDVKDVTVNGRGTCVRQTLDGRRTENARFLHLFLEDADNSGVSVTVWGYNFAFGRWAVLQLPAGFDTGDARALSPDNPANPADVLQASVDASTAESSYVDATFTATSTPRMHVLPIAGIDKVWFSTTAADDVSVIIGASITTF